MLRVLVIKAARQSALERSLLLVPMQKLLYGAGEMAQWIRVLAALAEDLRSVPSIHITVHKHQQVHFTCPNATDSVNTRHT